MLITVLLHQECTVPPDVLQSKAVHAQNFEDVIILTYTDYVGCVITYTDYVGCVIITYTDYVGCVIITYTDYVGSVPITYTDYVGCVNITYTDYGTIIQNFLDPAQHTSSIHMPVRYSNIPD